MLTEYYGPDENLHAQVIDWFRPVSMGHLKNNEDGKDNEEDRLDSLIAEVKFD